MSGNRSILGRIVDFFASLRLAVFLLAILLVLTVWGTVFQVEHGLYAAQRQFYASWFFLAGGFFPFPGARLVMTVLLVNLLVAGIKVTIRHGFRLGLFLTHFGIIIMILAGAATFYFGTESHLSLVENSSANVSISGREWELAVWKSQTNGDARDIFAINAAALTPDTQVTCPAGNFQIAVEEYHVNCDPLKDATVKNPPMNESGITSLQDKPDEREPEDNKPGAVFTISSGGKTAGRLLLWGMNNAPAELEIGGTNYTFDLRRRRYLLPATIKLVEFTKIMYPGSDTAKSFSSRVLVRPEHGIERPVTISMNKPLRFEGYTFYQSSYFPAGNGRDGSVFAVVKNYGRVMPYIATGVTVLGMLVYFVGMLFVRIQHKAREVKP